MRNKDFLINAGVLLIVVVMVLSSIVVTANINEETRKKINNSFYEIPLYCKGNLTGYINGINLVKLNPTILTSFGIFFVFIISTRETN